MKIVATKVYCRWWCFWKWGCLRTEWILVSFIERSNPGFEWVAFITIIKVICSDLVKAPSVFGLKQVENSLAQLVGRGHVHDHWLLREGVADGRGDVSWQLVRPRVGGEDILHLAPASRIRLHWPRPSGLDQEVRDAGGGVWPVADLENRDKYEGSFK